MKDAPGNKSWFEQANGSAQSPVAKVHPAYTFLKYCHDWLLADVAGLEHVLPFTFATNDGSMRVVYAEGFLEAHMDGVVHVLKGTGTTYQNLNRHMKEGADSKPFDPYATGNIEVAIRFTPENVVFKVPSGGVKVLNPAFEPRWTDPPDYGPTADKPAELTGGLLYGVEEIPPNYDDPVPYPKTVFSIGFDPGSRELTRMPFEVPVDRRVIVPGPQM